jgi:hypothetical protein
MNSTRHFTAMTFPMTWVLIVLWLTAAAGALLAWLLHLLFLSILTGLASFLFIVVLIWELARARPRAEDLPALAGEEKLRFSFCVRIVLIMVAVMLTFGVGLMIGTGATPVLVAGLAGLGLTLAWRHDLERRMVTSGVALGLLAGLGIIVLRNGDLTWAIFNG